jgi:outer membrane protein OmpA-like peptidoglycan-associated protein
MTTVPGGQGLPIPSIHRARAFWLALIGLLMLAGSIGTSPARALEGDPVGAADHPLIPRYEGAAIIGYDHRAFERFRLPLAMPERDAAGSVVLAEHRDIEGRHTRIIYAAPAERSSLEVFHNYERALAEHGFEILFACSGDDCGERGLFAGELLYAPDRRLRTLGPVTEFAFSFPLQPFYIAARLTRDDGDIHVSLYVARENFDAFPETHNRTLVLLDVIEPGTLEDRIDPNGGTDAMGVDATVLLGLESPPDASWADIAAAESDDIERALRAAGRVAIYSIAFDSGKARLTEDSYPALGEIAEVLDRNPGLSLFVVGHTDNEGGYQYNLNLSRQRAEAVVTALVEREEIERGRLDAAGVGMLAPVASNETEAGRARNRRVELVVQQ